MSGYLEELSGLWQQFNSGWYRASVEIPERLKLNDVFTDQGRRLVEMVLKQNNEFGALIIKDGKEVELAFFQVGEEHEINLSPTRPLKEEEYILGTFHGHPTRDYPSTTDAYTFLISWEQISVIVGVKGTVYLLLKIEQTVEPTESLDEFDREYETGQNIRDIAQDYNFILYLGQINKNVLRLEVGESEVKELTIDELLKNIKGVKTVQKTIKKVKLDNN